MNLSRPFVERPVATVLLTIGLALAGIMAFVLLPVARLPAVDFPVIFVSANLPGASPADMARAVATPLERTLGTIAGVNEMTSSSSSGSTRVVLQFDLERDIDSAARDVQAAINAARADLPASLRSNPTYRKANPAARPFMILALTSRTRTPGQIYDAVSNVMEQRLLQVDGVGDVQLGGGSLPAVRIQLNPLALNALGIGSEDVRAAIQGSNANRPLGTIQTGTSRHGRQLQVLVPPPGLRAADYRDLVVGMRNGSEIRLSQVAEAIDDVEDRHTRGIFNGRPAVIATITQQPGANLIATADAIHELLPTLRAQLPPDVDLQLAMDRTGAIRDSVRNVEMTLVIAVLLVVAVVGLFLRNLRAAAIPAVATGVSLLGTFGIMLALGFSLNNLTLMALTIATGFVVDDAIVVLENISRHLELGRSRRQAALQGTREVGFTVLTISLSLVAVFIPLLFMGGQVGRMFREFAVTLSGAVMISLLIALTTTPMLCAMLLPVRASAPLPRRSLSGRLRAQVGAALARFQRRLTAGYARALDWSLHWPWLVVLLLAAVVGLSVLMFLHIPKGYFPEQDSGQMFGGLRADQSISSAAMGEKLQQAVDLIHADPAMDTVVAFAGGRGAGGGFLAAALKPLRERPARESTRTVINRLRPRLEQITGLSIFLMPSQELRMGGGGRQSNSAYQYVLKADNQDDLNLWTGRLAHALQADARLVDVDADQRDNGVETYIRVDRAKAASLGVSSSDINATLYDAFGQRQVATLYSDLNQYAVVMEWAPEYATSPAVLKDIEVPVRGTAGGGDGSDSANPAQRDASRGDPISAAPRAMVPLSVLASFSERAVPAEVRHDGGELSSTIAFDLADGVSLQAGQEAVLEAVAAVAPPNSVRGAFAGAAAAAQQMQSQQGVLILAAIVVIYIVLGILYESLIHPITVLSTLPSAGFGAVIALLVLDMEFSIMALIGVFLLIGIVKKNAILIIDFALQAQRTRGLTAQQAAREASLLRFRPILMTTLAAGLGALPLAVGLGQGAELHRPLGVTIVGGLIASQFFTLLTTPAVYVLLDRLQPRRRLRPAAGTIPSAA
ncbi:MAG: efflux RND transporter permease subunit [Ottowia sp.]|nr:efflux RND transporter permease subunit [Ottowia sp.]